MRWLETGLATSPGPPYVRSRFDVRGFHWLMAAGVAPAAFAGVWFFGLRVLVLIGVSCAAAGLVEGVVAKLRRRHMTEGFLVIGLLFALTLPPGLPLWMAGLGAAFGMLVGRELLGGAGRNLFNPAIVGRVFLAIAYPEAMGGNWITPGSGVLGRLGQYVDAGFADAVTSATPLMSAGQGHWVETWRLFVGNVAGSAGETSAMAILAGGVFLLAMRVVNWRTMVATLGTFAVLEATLRLADPSRFPPTSWSVLAGGLLFGAVFLATDPVTSPATHGAKWAYGAIVGCMTVLIRGLTAYPEGMMFAILLGNIVAPVLDELAIGHRLRRLGRGLEEEGA